MGYCDLENIQKALPMDVLMRLTDDEDRGAIDEEKVDEAIEAGAEEINTYLGSLYDLPLSSIPAILEKLNIDIAIYNLYARITESVPETRQKRYENAIRFLEKVAKGELTLGSHPPPDPVEEGNYAGAAQTSVRTKVFDSTTMDKY
jgi:phage gp36-like protein